MKTFIITAALAGMIWCSAYAQHKTYSTPYVPGNEINVWPDIQSFTADIREATRVYQDTNKAKTAGYRPFGPDIPNMGKHWINTGLIVDTLIDPLRPEVLTYLNVNGRSVLAGVAYATAILPGQNPPKLPFEEMRWHFHSGSIEEEAYGIRHDYTSYEKKKKIRLAMVHVWVWAENPDGLFEKDNWALSYRRLALPYPKKSYPDAAKALFMVQGGVDYYLQFVRLSIHPDAETLKEVRSIFEKYTNKVKGISHEMKDRDSVLLPDQEKLVLIWNEMWQEVKKTIGNSSWEQLASNLTLNSSDEN